jgi:hypothetical protein
VYTIGKTGLQMATSEAGSDWLGAPHQDSEDVHTNPDADVHPLGRDPFPATKTWKGTTFTQGILNACQGICMDGLA